MLNPTIKLFILSILSLTILSSCQQNSTDTKEPTAPVEIKAANWVAAVADHLKYENQIESEVARRNNLEQPKLYSVILEETAEPVPLRDLLQGNALLCAAECYALTTQDFDVRVSEVIDNGFYPFLDLPESVKPDMSITHNGNQVELFTGKSLNGIGTSDWLIGTKNRILSNYYKACYYAHCTGCSKTKSEFPDDYIINIPRNPSFWINPVTEQPMVESNLVGDYRLIDRTGFLSSMIVPMIENGITTKEFICINNIYDSNQLISRVVSSDGDNDEVPMCCFIGEYAHTIPAGSIDETDYLVYCPPDREGGSTCKIRWRFQQDSVRADIEVLVARCSDLPEWPDEYNVTVFPCPVGGDHITQSYSI